MKLVSAILTGLAVAASAQDRSHRKASLGSQGSPAPHGPGGDEDSYNQGYQNGVSICDKYAASILGANTFANQQLLMTLFVNTGMVGNYSEYNVGIPVNGVIWPGEFQGRPVNQMGYFNSALASSNLAVDRGHGIAINWFDGGGPAALRQNLAAFNTSSNQQRFISHLHEYFAYLLGCSEYGNTVDRYNGSTNMYHVHKYMALGDEEQQYTNLQFVLSGASLGFERQDLGYVAGVLEWLFSHRCSPPKSVPKWAPPALQAMCTEPDCPVYPHDAVCTAYDPVVEPKLVRNGSQNIQ